MSVNKTIEDLLVLLQSAPITADSAQRDARVRELVQALDVHKMADLRTLLDAICGLKLQERRLSPEDLGVRIKNSIRDDRAFAALMAKAEAPRAYSATELIQVYNTALDRRERFAKNISKKKILGQLRAEREIILSNDFSRATIIAHAKGGTA